MKEFTCLLAEFAREVAAAMAAVPSSPSFVQPTSSDGGSVVVAPWRAWVSSMLYQFLWQHIHDRRVASRAVAVNVEVPQSARLRSDLRFDRVSLRVIEFGG